MTLEIAMLVLVYLAVGVLYAMYDGHFIWLVLWPVRFVLGVVALILWALS